MNYPYPVSYKVKPVAEQILKLYELFPKITLAGNLTERDSHPEADGIFVIPHFKQFGTYNEAVERVLAKIKETRKFYNWRAGEMGPNHLRQTKVKEVWWENQPDTILIPAQTGKKYAGKSVKDVRSGLTDSLEVPLGAYEMGIILLTHPERLQDYNDLWIDCPGDQFRSEARGGWDKAPLFVFFGGQLELDAGFVHRKVDHCGSVSVSGFVSQSVGSGPSAASKFLTLAPLDPSEKSLMTIARNSERIANALEMFCNDFERGYKLVRDGLATKKKVKK